MRAAGITGFDMKIRDVSGTITAGGTSQSLTAQNRDRFYIFIQNVDVLAESLFINFTSAATVNATPDSIELIPGAAFEMNGSYVPTDQINIIAATTAHKFVAKVG